MSHIDPRGEPRTPSSTAEGGKEGTPASLAGTNKLSLGLLTMQSADPFKFRKFLKRLVLCMQGLLRYSDFLLVDESNPSAALRTLAALLKQEFEDDFLELSCRIYEAWRTSQRDTAAETITKAISSAVGRQRCRAMTILAERTADNIGRCPQVKPAAAFIPCRRSEVRAASPKRARSTQSLSPPESVPKSTELLKSAPTKAALIRELYSPMSKQSAELLGFERLYEDHIRRKRREEARREAREEFDAQNLSFSPSVNNTGLPPRTRIPVFERLTQIPDTRSRSSVTSEEREFLSSSFTPSLTSKQFYSSGMDTSAMHDRAKDYQKKVRQLQIKARDEEVAPCSFAPAIRSRPTSASSNSSSHKSIFDKLYELHRRTQRKLRQKAEQRSLEESKSVTFHPSINARSHQSSVDSPSSTASERLFADFRVRQEKMSELRAKYSSPSIPPSRTHSTPVSVDTPAYERLYDLQKGLRERQFELKAKVMREEGVTFKPTMIAKTRGSK